MRLFKLTPIFMLAILIGVACSESNEARRLAG